MLASKDPVQTYARNILIVNGCLAYQEPIILPGEHNVLKKWNDYRTSHFISNSYMKLFPNPAHQFIILEYNLQNLFNENSSFELIITDMSGIVLERRNLNKKQDQVLINTTTYKPGSYTCSIKTNGKILETKKFIIN
jgi:hypothetical protein